MKEWKDGYTYFLKCYKTISFTIKYVYIILNIYKVILI